MRKVVTWELVSLDGVMESPEEWSFSYSNDEMAEANAAGMAASDAKPSRKPLLATVRKGAEWSSIALLAGAQRQNHHRRLVALLEAR